MTFTQIIIEYRNKSCADNVWTDRTIYRWQQDWKADSVYRVHWQKPNKDETAH